jgi:hypothetical protein
VVRPGRSGAIGQIDGINEFDLACGGTIGQLKASQRQDLKAAPMREPFCLIKFGGKADKRIWVGGAHGGAPREAC